MVPSGPRVEKASRRKRHGGQAGAPGIAARRLPRCRSREFMSLADRSSAEVGASSDGSCLKERTHQGAVFAGDTERASPKNVRTVNTIRASPGQRQRPVS